MGFLGFESKAEKQLRLLTLDIENKFKKEQATREGRPYFGVRYEDDDRKESEKLK